MPIARDAIDRSMAIGVAGEICGEFREADGVYVIDMYTIGAWKACSYMRVKAHSYIGLTYHTHVALGFDQATRDMLGNPRFSDEDYAHPGYMASGNKVLFQRGAGTERRVRAQ